jgi:hypothetical protein
MLWATCTYLKVPVCFCQQPQCRPLVSLRYLHEFVYTSSLFGEEVSDHSKGGLTDSQSILSGKAGLRGLDMKRAKRYLESSHG